MGAILGGVLISKYGIIWAYRAGGVATVIITIQFALTQWFIREYESDSEAINNRKSKKIIDPIENEDMDVGERAEK